MGSPLPTPLSKMRGDPGNKADANLPFEGASRREFGKVADAHTPNGLTPAPAKAQQPMYQLEDRDHRLGRQTAAYALARGIPGVLNFLSLALFTRLLGPKSFGEYALALSAVNLFSTVGFYWLNQGLVRFYAEEAKRHLLLSTIFRAFVCSSAVAILAGTAFAIHSNIKVSLLLAGSLLLIAQAWHNLQLQLCRSQMAPRRYARLSLAKAVIAPVAAWILITFDFGATGVLLALAAAYLLPALVGARATWAEALVERPSKEVTRELLAYGGPLMAMFALRFIVNSSDRFMIAHFMGTHAAGVYSAAAELAGNSLGFLTSVIQLASFPIIIRAFENGGPKAAAPHYMNNLTLLTAITLPAAVGLSLLAPQISNTFFPPTFAKEASALLPWIALGTLVAMLKAVGFDVTFHLTKRTTLQLIVVLVAAAMNVVLNFFLIPKWGILGAAKATVATHSFALITSLVLGRHLLRLPFPLANILRISGATAIMAILLAPTLHWEEPSALPIQILIGIFAFCASGYILNIPVVRRGIAILTNPGELRNANKS